MKQHSIDLMPASTRLRTQAGLRAGRFIAASIVLLLAIVVVATHSRLLLTRAQKQLFAVTSQTQAVMELDQKATELSRTLQQTEAFIGRYHKVAFPIDVSAVMATVINALPQSVALDQLNVDAGVRTSARSPRARGTDGRESGAPRVLLCEMWGFAATDEDIAQLVSRLESTAPFRQVNLDFSRTRKVHERDAREFRLSFKVDLATVYAVAYSDAGQSSGGMPK